MQKSLNDITDLELEEVKKMAAMFFTPREIALVLQVEIEMFIHYCEVEDHRIFNAFKGGRLLSEMELRASILKLAKSGSSPAQTMSLELLRNSKIEMLKR